MAGAARSPIAVVCVPVVYATPPPRPCPVTPTPVVFALMVDVPASFTTDSLLNVVAPAMITGHRLSLAHAASCAARTLYKVLLPTLRTRATCPTPKPAPSIVLAASKSRRVERGFTSQPLTPTFLRGQRLAGTFAYSLALPLRKRRTRNRCTTMRPAAVAVSSDSVAGNQGNAVLVAEFERCGKGRVRNGSADPAY